MTPLPPPIIYFQHLTAIPDSNNLNLKELRIKFPLFMYLRLLTADFD